MEIRSVCQEKLGHNTRVFRSPQLDPFQYQLIRTFEHTADTSGIQESDYQKAVFSPHLEILWIAIYTALRVPDFWPILSNRKSRHVNAYVEDVSVKR